MNNNVLSEELIETNREQIIKQKKGANRLAYELAVERTRIDLLKKNLRELDPFYPDEDIEVLHDIKRLVEYGSGGALCIVISKRWLDEQGKKKGDSINILAMP